MKLPFYMPKFIYNKMVRAVTEDIYTRVINGVTKLKEDCEIFLDKELTMKYSENPLFNSLCHMNAIQIAEKLKVTENFYEVTPLGVIVTFQDSRKTNVHFIVRVKETKDSEYKYFDPTYGFVGYYNNKDGIFRYFSLFNDDHLKEIDIEYLKDPNKLLSEYKKNFLITYIESIDKYHKNFFKNRFMKYSVYYIIRNKDVVSII